MNRTVLKTMTYGLMHLSVAVVVAYALTRSWTIALAVGVVEPVVQTVFFAIHERLWSQADIGARTTKAMCGHALWMRRPAA